MRILIKSFVRPAVGHARRELTRWLRGDVATATPSHGHELTDVRIDGVPHPIRVRLASSDARSMASCLLDLQYDVDLGFEPKTILDLGGNIGCSAIYFANRWPNARICVVEPFKENFELLKHNTEPYPNIQPIHAAAHSVRGRLRLQVPQTGFWGVQAVPHTSAHRPDSNSVAGKTVCDLMDEAGFDRIDLLKMDIEGSELDLFRSSPDEWLTRTRVVAVELHDWVRVGCSWYFERALAKYRTRRIAIDENIVVWLEGDAAAKVV